MSGNERINIFVSTFKDTYNKVIEFGEAPSKQVTDHKLIDASDSIIVDEEEFRLMKELREIKRTIKIYSIKNIFAIAIV